MSERKRIWVSPDGEKGWDVKTQGKSKAAANFDDKVDAIKRAKEIAQNTPKSQVIIQKKDGKIQTEFTYGSDPYPPKG